MASYEDNVYNWLKKAGYADKYEHAGIYCIKIDHAIVYIGKSYNMLKRVAQHYVGIKKQAERKYRILSEAQRKGHEINFDVLYSAKERGYTAVTQEIGAKEGEYIRQFNPLLNTQIPKEDDWHKWDVNTLDAREILKTIL